MTDSKEKVVDFDEVISGDGEMPEASSGRGRATRMERAPEADGRSPFGGGVAGSFGRGGSVAWQMGRKLPWWLWPLLLVGGLLLGLIALAVFIFIGIPLMIFRLLIPKSR